MNIDSVYEISQRALRDDMNSMARIANNIANNDGDTIDLTKNITDMKLTQRNYEANIAVIKTADDMYRELLSFF
ncbi:MAG: hypothetical protein A2017_06780 [Lentisphaerae bacterium GWF2_44_16]|nr:MAG: hypothetical protein A2017_06780 [Lentisphaerae bacterium GWF2_44_16]